MSRPNDAEVLRAFLAYVGQQLARFTQEPLFYRRTADDLNYLLTFRQPARLNPDLLLVVRHYVAVADGGVETAGYHYALENADGKEIVVYHWHPLSLPSHPHLHLKSGALVARQDLTTAHIPTGYISWSELLWLVSELTGET